MSQESEPNFAQLVGKITPIKKSAVAPEFGQRPKRRPIVRRRPVRDAVHYRALEPLCHNFDQISPTLYRQMCQGRAYCAEHIDLHGKQVTTALNCLSDLLEQRRNRHLVCWHIVHGKGQRSPAYDRAPLKHAVIEFLLNHPAVAAIATVSDSDGASGGVVIALQPMQK